MTPLEEVLQYRNPELVERFAKDQGIPISDAQEVFTDLLRWLWLCASVAKDPSAKSRNLFMTRDMEIVDEIWHSFLLFSKEYAEFCDRYFGFFLHHNPSKAPERVDGGSDDLEGRLYTLYEIVYDKLGETVLNRWTGALSQRFTRLPNQKQWQINENIL